MPPRTHANKSAGRSSSKAERELADLEGVCSALAHHSRRHILLVLHFRGGQMTAGEVAARFSCSWPTTTRHLRVLLEAGLVTVSKRGRERVYRLEPARMQATIGRWLETFGLGEA